MSRTGRVLGRLAAGATALAGLATAGVALLGRRYDGVVTGEDERHTARTADGWNLGLYRYLPRGETRVPHPVVCGHGFAGTHLIYDVRADVSLARYLAAEGFDVWLVDLRGRGASWPDAGPSSALQWTFDDFVWQDLPAAVTAACEHAGSEQAFWLGMEVSGQALYAASLAHTVPQLRAGVTFGAPAVTPPDAQVPGVTAPPRAERNGRVPFRAGAAWAGPVLAHAQPGALASSFRAENTDPAVAATYLRNGVPDEAIALVDQFREWVETGRFASRDGIDFAARLPDLELPLLLLSAARDLQRPTAAVRDTFDAIGSDDKRLVVAGRDEGFAVDYGHDDLLAGNAAPAEIFPLVADWLRDHA